MITPLNLLTGEEGNLMYEVDLARPLAPQVDPEALSYAEFTPPGWDIKTFTAEERTDLSEQNYLFQEPKDAIYEEVDVSTGEIRVMIYDDVLERLTTDDE